MMPGSRNPASRDLLRTLVIGELINGWQTAAGWRGLLYTNIFS